MFAAGAELFSPRPGRTAGSEADPSSECNFERDEERAARTSISASMKRKRDREYAQARRDKAKAAHQPLFDTVNELVQIAKTARPGRTAHELLVRDFTSKLKVLLRQLRHSTSRCNYCDDTTPTSTQSPPQHHRDRRLVEIEAELEHAKTRLAASYDWLEYDEEVLASQTRGVRCRPPPPARPTP